MRKRAEKAQTTRTRREELVQFQTGSDDAPTSTLVHASHVLNNGLSDIPVVGAPELSSPKILRLPS
jgi:hypothetical protein